MTTFTTYFQDLEIETSIESNGKTISVAYDGSGAAVHATESIEIEAQDSLTKMNNKINSIA